VVNDGDLDPSRYHRRDLTVVFRRVTLRSGFRARLDSRARAAARERANERLHERLHERCTSGARAVHERLAQRIFNARSRARCC
jgi:hypothetical protein